MTAEEASAPPGETAESASVDARSGAGLPLHLDLQAEAEGDDEYVNDDPNIGDEEFEDEFFDDYIVRAKWSIDGAATLAEAAQAARDFADSLQKLHDEGFVLRSPIEDDYGFYYKPESQEQANV